MEYLLLILVLIICRIGISYSVINITINDVCEGKQMFIRCYNSENLGNVVTFSHNGGTTLQYISGRGEQTFGDWVNRTNTTRSAKEYDVTLRDITQTDEGPIECNPGPGPVSTNVYVCACPLIENLHLQGDFDHHFEGMSDIFSCNLTRVKPANRSSISWTLGDMNIPSTSYYESPPGPDGVQWVHATLNRTLEKSDNTRTLSCLAQWDGKTAASASSVLDVKYPPYPKDNTEDLMKSGAVGDSITLVCDVDANPEPNYTWYRNTTAGVLGHDRTLTINITDKGFFGEYICLAANPIGNLTQIFEILEIFYGSVAMASASTGLSLVTLFGLIPFIILRRKANTGKSTKHSSKTWPIVVFTIQNVFWIAALLLITIGLDTIKASDGSLPAIYWVAVAFLILAFLTCAIELVELVKPGIVSQHLCCGSRVSL